MDYAKEKKELLLMRQIYTTLMSLTKKLDKLEKESFDGLTLRQCIAILAILHAKDETSMVSIAKKLGTTKQNVDQMVAVLEKKGYVERTVNEINKRMVNMKVTDSGERAMQVCVGKSASLMMDIFNGLSESEMEMMLQFSRKLYSYDGEEYTDYFDDIIRILDGEYSDLVISILEECKRRKERSA